MFYAVEFSDCGWPAADPWPDCWAVPCRRLPGRSRRLRQKSTESRGVGVDVLPASTCFFGHLPGDSRKKPGPVPGCHGGYPLTKRGR